MSESMLKQWIAFVGVYIAPIAGLILASIPLLLLPAKPYATVDQHNYISLLPIEELIESIRKANNYDTVQRVIANNPLIDKVPNTIHVFEIRNPTGTLVEKPVYNFETAGRICFVHITDGYHKDELQANFTIDSAFPNIAHLPIEELRPGSLVRGYICSKVAHSSDQRPMEITASAKNATPSDLTLSGERRSLARMIGRWSYVGFAILIVVLLNLFWRRKKQRQRATIYEDPTKVLAAGQRFAKTGKGIMFWHNVPTGWLHTEEGFIQFLEPALRNNNIKRIVFILNEDNELVKKTFSEKALLFISASQNLKHDLDSGKKDGSCGKVAWFYGQVDGFTPPFKLIVDDTRVEPHYNAQVMMSFTERNVVFENGERQRILAPDIIIETDDESLLDGIHRLAMAYA